MMLLLSKHPEVKAKLQQEIDDVYGGRDRLAHDDLPRLRYLMLVLKETLRLYPIGYGTVREPGNDDNFTVGGVRVPAGVSCPARRPAPPPPPPPPSVGLSLRATPYF